MTHRMLQLSSLRQSSFGIKSVIALCLVFHKVKNYAESLQTNRVFVYTLVEIFIVYHVDENMNML